MKNIDANDIRRIDGGLLLVFRELLRRRRTTQVAHALGLSQSAISHSLARLRDLFADPLFVRRPHGLEPTRLALVLGPRIEELIGLTHAVLQRDGAFDPALSDRRFNMAAAEFVIALIGAPLVQTMRAQAPKASFLVSAMPHPAAFEALRRGDIDLAIGRFGAMRADFVSEVLIEDRYCVVARRGHPRFKGRIAMSAYRSAGHVFSYVPGEGGENEDLPQASQIATNAIVPRWLTALSIVAASDAIATVPKRLAQRQAEIMGLQILNAPFVNDRITVSVARRAGLHDPGAEWFLEKVREAAQR